MNTGSCIAVLALLVFLLIMANLWLIDWRHERRKKIVLVIVKNQSGNQVIVEIGNGWRQICLNPGKSAVCAEIEKLSICVKRGWNDKTPVPGFGPHYIFCRDFCLKDGRNYDLIILPDSKFQVVLTDVPCCWMCSSKNRPS
ncbi:MAG: hypothetical protein WCL61_03180 [bacterium]